MKTIKNSILSIMVLGALSLTSCKNDTSKNTSMVSEASASTQEEMIQDTAIQFNDEATASLYNTYIEVKTAFVNSDLEAVKKASKNFTSDLKEANAMKTATSIEDAREQLPMLTQAVEKTLENAIKEGKIYKQYCPMALDNSGAYWLSSEKKIRNPYFGDKMLKCGKVTATIE